MNGTPRVYVARACRLGPVSLGQLLQHHGRNTTSWAGVGRRLWATYHTTPNPGILSSSIHPPSSSLPLSIMVVYGSCLPVTSVGAAGPYGSFRLPDVLVAASMVHNLLSIRHFTVDNSCSVEFDSSSLTVKDLASRCPLLRCDSTGPLYTLRFPASASPPSPVLSAVFATTTSTTWH